MYQNVREINKIGVIESEMKRNDLLMERLYRSSEVKNAPEIRLHLLQKGSIDNDLMNVIKCDKFICYYIKTAVSS